MSGCFLKILSAKDQYWRMAGPPCPKYFLDYCIRFLRPKWPNLFFKFLATEHCFGNYWRSTTFFDTRAWWARVLYFLIHRDTMTWKVGIKIFRLVLEHLKLEYHLFISCYCNNLRISFSPNYRLTALNFICPWIQALNNIHKDVIHRLPI